jgi:ribosome maturation factor RimP
MLWKRARKNGADEVEALLEPVGRGLELSLVELNVSRHKGSAQVRAVVFKRGGLGINDCAQFHRAITPRLELVFGADDLHIEVSSPGIDREIREGAEFEHYVGCPVACYPAGGPDWRGGVLERVTETFIEIKGKEGMEKLEFADIAKAKLDSKAAK